MVVCAATVVAISSCEANLQSNQQTITPVSAEKVVILNSQTNSDGQTKFHDPLAGTEIPVKVVEKRNQYPVPSVQVYFLSDGPRFLVIAVDVQRRYLASWVEGAYSKSIIDARTQGGLFEILAPRAETFQSVQSVLFALDRYQDILTFKDFLSLAKDPPKLYQWNLFYEDRCWTGEQLANYAGLQSKAAGIAFDLIIPGAVEAGGAVVDQAEEIMQALTAISLHTAEQDAKDLLMKQTRTFKIRTYKLGIPVISMVPLGYCDTPAPIPARVPTTVPPTRASTPSPTNIPAVSQFIGEWERAPQNGILYGWEKLRILSYGLTITAVDSFTPFPPPGEWQPFNFKMADNGELLISRFPGCCSREDPNTSVVSFMPDGRLRVMKTWSWQCTIQYGVPSQCEDIDQQDIYYYTRAGK